MEAFVQSWTSFKEEQVLQVIDLFRPSTLSDAWRYFILKKIATVVTKCLYWRHF